MDVSSWKWNPRYDLDLAQRCLFILCFTWFTNWIFQLTFLNYIFGNYLVHLGATIALLMAMAKSAFQFSSKEKSVLITGKFYQLFVLHHNYKSINKKHAFVARQNFKNYDNIIK